MAYLDRIVDIYKKEENDGIIESSLETVKTAALFMFYHYYNADVTKLDDLNNQFCFLTGDIADIIAINYNYYEDNTIDFITVLPASIMTNLDRLDFTKIYNDFLKRINEVVANVIVRNENQKNGRILDKFDEFEVDDNTQFNVVILCNYPVSIENKLWYQKGANDFIVKNNKIHFQILFEDDILEEVSDVESPKDSVQKGELVLFDSSVSFFGKEKSFLCFISAKSLKDNYLLYSTHGLFASNLRYYVKSAKIDSQIINTINEEPENFCYFNNGIIITCDDYIIEKNRIKLMNFSIVNGGQTTNLIGRTPFEKDFAVMCKVIKNKYSNQLDKVDFLSKVAEASNTQKPIKAKDLIANRKEQRLLKIQFEEANMFLQVKRGEKITKDIYSEPWQNAANDNVAQMIYSLVYQCPGSAKNSKSKLLENEKTYSRLFSPIYNSLMFVSLQHLKVGFNNWVKKLKKVEKYGSSKLGLGKNGDLLIVGITGLIYKLLSNDDLFSKICSYKKAEINNENEDLKFLISQNDIGELPLFNSDLINNIGKSTFFNYFELIFVNILIPAYDSFKKDYPTYSYGNFAKTDSYYYKYVVPATVLFVKESKDQFNYADIFDFSKSTHVIIDRSSSFNDYKPGLEEELKEYRTRTSKNLGVPAYEVFKNNQMASIIRFKIRKIDELRSTAKMSEIQCEKYGEAICKIVAKYADVSDYKSE